MRSKSHNSLHKRLQDLAQLYAAHTARAGTSAGRKYGVDALNRAGLVLLSAHLEGFIEDLVKETIDVIIANSVPMKLLPLRLRAVQVEKDLVEPISGDNYVRTNARISKVGPIIAQFWTDIQPSTTSNLSAQPIIKVMNNPGTNLINRMFWYFDIDQVMDRISWKKASNKTVKDNINKLVGKRNEIAHGAIEINVTKSEVKKYEKYVNGVAASLDSHMKQFLKLLIGKDPW